MGIGTGGADRSDSMGGIGGNVGGGGANRGGGGDRTGGGIDQGRIGNFSGGFGQSSATGSARGLGYVDRNTGQAYGDAQRGSVNYGGWASSPMSAATSLSQAQAIQASMARGLTPASGYTGSPSVARSMAPTVPPAVPAALPAVNMPKVSAPATVSVSNPTFSMDNPVQTPTGGFVTGGYDMAFGPMDSITSSAAFGAFGMPSAPAPSMGMTTDQALAAAVRGQTLSQSAVADTPSMAMSASRPSSTLSGRGSLGTPTAGDFMSERAGVSSTDAAMAGLVGGRAGIDSFGREALGMDGLGPRSGGTDRGNEVADRAGLPSRDVSPGVSSYGRAAQSVADLETPGWASTIARGLSAIGLDNVNAFGAAARDSLNATRAAAAAGPLGPAIAASVGVHGGLLSAANQMGLLESPTTDVAEPADTITGMDINVVQDTPQIEANPYETPARRDVNTALTAQNTVDMTPSLPTGQSRPTPTNVAGAVADRQAMAMEAAHQEAQQQRTNEIGSFVQAGLGPVARQPDAGIQGGETTVSKTPEGGGESTPEPEKKPRGLLEYSRNPPTVQWTGAASSKEQQNVKPALINVLNKAALSGIPIRVRSGYRNPAYNRKVGGARRSAHMTGDAVDISLNGLSDAQRTELTVALINAGAKRVGAYSGNTGLHVDMRDWGRGASHGDFHAMFDKTSRKLDKAPGWFKRALKQAQKGMAMKSSPSEAQIGDKVKSASGKEGTLVGFTKNGSQIVELEDGTREYSRAPKGSFNVNRDTTMIPYLGGIAAGAARDEGLTGRMNLDGVEPSSNVQIAKNQQRLPGMDGAPAAPEYSGYDPSKSWALGPDHRLGPFKEGPSAYDVFGGDIPAPAAGKGGLGYGGVSEDVNASFGGLFAAPQGQFKTGPVDMTNAPVKFKIDENTALKIGAQKAAEYVGPILAGMITNSRMKKEAQSFLTREGFKYDEKTNTLTAPSEAKARALIALGNHYGVDASQFASVDKIQSRIAASKPAATPKPAQAPSNQTVNTGIQDERMPSFQGVNRVAKSDRLQAIEKTAQQEATRNGGLIDPNQSPKDIVAVDTETKTVIYNDGSVRGGNDEWKKKKVKAALLDETVEDISTSKSLQPDWWHKWREASGRYGLLGAGATPFI